MEKLYHTEIDTPIGVMQCCASDKGLYLLEFHDRPNLNETIRKLATQLNKQVVQAENEIANKLRKELQLYFKGELQFFTTPTIFTGTDFQEEVWHALLKVPYGKTRTYKEQTDILGNPKAIRAVASANGKNKIAIVVPCHRIIGSDGSLTGYAGGLNRKRYLLSLEHSIAGPKDLFST